MKKAPKLLVVFLLLLSLTSCLGREIIPLPVVSDYDIVDKAAPSDKLRVGLVPGLYSDIFTQAIQPSLEKMGYTIEITYYDNQSLPNVALARNQIDLNVYQHYKSLNKYKFENDAALSAIAEIPTAPMGIFSSEYDSFQEIKNGTTVAIPIESADLSRTLILLENAGLILLNPLIEKDKATVADITSNPHSLEFITLQNEDLLQSLSTCGLSVIDGRYAMNGDLKLSDAIYLEVLNRDYLIVIAVRTDNLHAQFVSDIINVLYSYEYKSAIAMVDGAVANYQKPRSFYK